MTDTRPPVYIVELVGGSRDGDTFQVPNPDIRSVDVLADPNPDDPLAAATNNRATYRAADGDDWTPDDTRPHVHRLRLLEVKP